MKERIEQEHDLQLKREELRLMRQQEAEDKKIRKQELVNLKFLKKQLTFGAKLEICYP